MDFHMWRLWIFFQSQLKCVIIGHSQRRPMNLNFDHGRDSPHLLRILIPPLWLWGISIFRFSMNKQSSAKSFDTLKSFKNKLKERDDYFKFMFITKNSLQIDHPLRFGLN
jgi:hypothetical protein